MMVVSTEDHGGSNFLSSFDGTFKSVPPVLIGVDTLAGNDSNH